MCCKLSTLHLSITGRSAINQWTIDTSHIIRSTRIIDCRMYNRSFSTPPSDERSIFRSWRIRTHVLPASHNSATTPAARALEQAAVQALPGYCRSRRARWRKKQTKRFASSREKAANHGEHSNFHYFNDTILDLLRTYI